MITMKHLLVLAIILLFHTKNFAEGNLGEDFQYDSSMDVKADPWQESLRLPSSVYPTRYVVYMYPDLASQIPTFTGSVSITVNSSEARDSFYLHQKDLTITRTVVKHIDGSGNYTDVTVNNAFGYNNSSEQFWVIQTDPVLQGQFQIELDFSGNLTGKIIGFYFSQYTNGNNESVPLATTKFQPTYARQAFPCFDEPSFRSVYEISVVRPSDGGYIGLSNMPVQSEVPDSPSVGLTTTIFEPSVTMVTYLSCFIISDFKSIETTVVREDGTVFPFKVYAPAEKLYAMTYSMGVGIDILLYYEKMFELLFPLPKCDMAAIPDYSSGATEHWGIITYRESNLFYNDQTSSPKNKQRVAEVIAHEMAHQWFGNLVTLEWWDDLWLNEGFASYIQYKGVDHSEPTWDIRTQFLVKELQYVFDVDSLLSSHPIVPEENSVETPEEITSMFDTISYSKGASVLRMLENFMGDSFQVGVNSFLVKYSYANAKTQDLYDQLTLAWQDSVPEGEESDISAIMNTWTLQMGYPTVNVTQQGDSLVFQQNRFLQNPTSISNPSDSPYGYSWTIALNFITSLDAAPKQYWMNYQNKSLNIAIPAGVEWYKVNSGQYGYYRVNYEASMWIKLQNLCSSKILSAADRSSLYNDALSLAAANELDYNVALDFTESLIDEDDYTPWSSAENKLYHMEYLLLSTNVSTSFKAFVAELLTPTYNRLQWSDLESDTHLDSLLRPKIVDLGCMSELSSCLDEAGTLLQSWIRDINVALPLDTKSKIYWWGLIRESDAATWNTMWDRSLAETVSTEKTNLYFGMANSQDEATLSGYITMSMNESNVRSQDFLNILEYISLNPAGSDLVWQWVQDNWLWLVDRYTLESRYLGQLIPSITKYFATQEKLDEMNAFFELYPEAGAGEKYRAQAIETVEFNIYWVNQNAVVIGSWLDSRAK